MRFIDKDDSDIRRLDEAAGLTVLHIADRHPIRGDMMWQILDYGDALQSLKRVYSKALWKKEKKSIKNLIEAFETYAVLYSENIVEIIDGYEGTVVIKEENNEIKRYHLKNVSIVKSLDNDGLLDVCVSIGDSFWDVTEISFVYYQKKN